MNMDHIREKLARESMMNFNKLTTEIEDLVTNIDTAIEYMERIAEQRGISIYELKNSDGSMSVAGLLNAKAHAFHTLVLLSKEE